jgi:hypothetical protein
MCGRDDDPSQHTIRIYVQSLIRDEGTIVVFGGYDVDTDLPVMFAADHRPAQDIIDAIQKGEGPIFVTIESWQVIG